MKMKNEDTNKKTTAKGKKAKVEASGESTPSVQDESVSPQLSEGTLSVEQADSGTDSTGDKTIATDTVQDITSDFVFVVNKETGVIGEVVRKQVYKAFDGKFSPETVDKTLNSMKVLANAPDYYSLDRKKLKKFEKAPESIVPQPSPDADDALGAGQAERFRQEHGFKALATETQTETPVVTETPSEVKDGAKNDAPDADVKDKTPEVPKQTYEGAENAPFEAGDKVINKNTSQFGMVVFKDGVLKIESTIDGKTKTSKQLDHWRVATPEEIEAEKAKTAIAKPDAPIHGEVVLPMTPEEKELEAVLRVEILAAKETYERAENIMAERISIVRDKQLWRESLNASGEQCKSFKEYVTDVLGFADKYGQNLAQIGDFRLVAKQIEGVNIDDLSVNANNAMVRGFNKIAAAIGLGELDFHEIRPIIEAGFDVLHTVVSDADGNVDRSLLKPQIITKTAEKILQKVETGVVEFQGQQMTVAEAKEKGVYNDAFANEVLSEVAEQIKTNKQYIKDNLDKAETERQAPVLTNGNLSQSTEEYAGKLPNLQIKCAKHGAVQVISIGNGVMQTSCTDRWRIDAATGKLVPYEIEGQKVKGK